MQAGTYRPVLIDKDNRIVNGHHRVDAAKILGFGRIKAIQFTEHTREDYLKLKDEIELQSGEQIDLELPVEYDYHAFDLAQALQ